MGLTSISIPVFDFNTSLVKDSSSLEEPLLSKSVQADNKASINGKYLIMDFWGLYSELVELVHLDKESLEMARKDFGHLLGS